MPTRRTPTSPVEIACDESGYEGEKLIGATTDVFAHASVHLDTGSAAACVQELRDRIRSPALEYKANHLLRIRHRAVLEWLLAPGSPLSGSAHVYLLDKAFFVIGAVVGALLGKDRRAEAMAVTLYGEGRRACDPGPWEAFLGSSNDLLRSRSAGAPVDSFLAAVEVLRRSGAPDRMDGILDRLRRARPRAAAFRARRHDHPARFPVLDPLAPAIVRAVAHWGGGVRPVAIVHDRQKALSQARTAHLGELLDGRLARLTLVDSRSDPRVQLADVLAGVARKIASDSLNGQGDVRLAALLRPYVDSSSVWADRGSWSLLRPGGRAASGSSEPVIPNPSLGLC